MNVTNIALLLAGEIVERLIEKPALSHLDWLPLNISNGFEKYTLDMEGLEDLLERYSVEPSSCQVQIVRIKRDLSRQLHEDHSSDTAVIILGERLVGENPVGVSLYSDGRWFAVGVGAVALFPAGAIQGFKVEEGGILYFLSVQISPTENSKSETT